MNSSLLLDVDEVAGGAVLADVVRLRRLSENGRRRDERRLDIDLGKEPPASE